MRTVTRTMTLAAAIVLLAACAPSGGGASGAASLDEASTITVAVADTDAGPRWWARTAARSTSSPRTPTDEHLQR